jgi:signal transduction histidine kinase
MAWPSLAGLQTRLVLVVLCAVIPALTLALYSDFEERHLRRAQVQEESLRLARLLSADHERLIEAAHQLLTALARLPAVRGGDRAACAALFADLLGQYPSYANLGVVAPDGRIVCSGLPGSAQYVGDRAYFQGALETRSFAIGDYQIGRITGKATINFGYPVLDETGRVRAVVFSALDLAWLGRLAAQAELPPGSILTVIDRNGTVLARFPDDPHWLGRPMPESSVATTILAGLGHGIVDGPGVDGIPRLFAFAPFGHASPHADAYLSVGVPRAVAFAHADRMLARNLIALGIVTALALAAAWVGGRLFIVRRMQALVEATRRLSAGDLGVRTGLSHGAGELGQLARAFDRMAESLQAADQRRVLEEELRRKNYELEQQNRSVAEANRLKTEFVSMVSHELRTPLTAIQGYAELLAEPGGVPDRDRHECLALVKSNAERLLALINDLLDLSRIEAGRIDLHCAAIDLGPLIKGAARSLRPVIDGRRQTLTLDLDDGQPTVVWGDADRVIQILTNLISNASKYTPEGGGITVTVRRAGDFASIDVRDTGVGLSAEQQAQLFTRFFRAHHPGSDHAGGTGLGLVITRSLVELHGGHVTVSSVPGHGSTFSFSLPVVPATPQAAAAAENPPAPAQGAADTRP